MENVNEEVEALQQKADYFFKNKTAVHIKFKRGYFKRGMITEISSDFFILQEFLEGSQPCFFLQIIDIEPFKKKEET